MKRLLPYLLIVLISLMIASGKADGIDFSLPTFHFPHVNDQGKFSYWTEIGEMDAGDGLVLPIHLNFSADRHSTSPSLIPKEIIQWAGEKPIVFYHENRFSEPYVTITERYFDLHNGRWMILTGKVKNNISTLQNSKELLTISRESLEEGTCWDGRNLYSYYKSYGHWTSISSDKAVGSRTIFQIMPHILGKYNPLVQRHMGKIEMNKLGIVTRQVLENIQKPLFISESKLLKDINFNVGEDPESLGALKVRRVLLTADSISQDRLLGFIYRRTDEGLVVFQVAVSSDAFEKGVRPWQCIRTIDGVDVSSLNGEEIAILLTREKIMLGISQWGENEMKNITVSSIEKDKLIDASGFVSMDTMAELRWYGETKPER